MRGMEVEKVLFDINNNMALVGVWNQYLKLVLVAVSMLATVIMLVAVASNSYHAIRSCQ